MNDHALRKVGHPVVLVWVASLAQTTMGRRDLLELIPSADLDEVLSSQRLVTQGQWALTVMSPPTVGGAEDIRPAVMHASTEGTRLEPEDLRAIAATSRAGEHLSECLSEISGDVPDLWGVISGIESHGALADGIEKAIDPSGDVLDSASSELRSIRRRLRAGEKRARALVDQLVRKLSEQGALQDETVSLREGRHVLPVRIENRKMVRGVVHDRSASGKTLFVEPMELVDAGNEIRELELAERNEILRILLELTDAVRSVAPDLLDLCSALGHVDSVLARARFGSEIDGIFPRIGHDVPLVIQRARHPLLVRSLGQEGVVPLDLCLAEPAGAVVITGPNTGGKTVALKTVGLLSALAQSGIPVPVAEGTTFPLIADTFADIGDEQSIEASLSTFSAHVARLSEICDQARPGVLVLLDELGSGTDPDEGAALGAAIIDHLVARGARVLVSTHLGALKDLATDRNDIHNAAMEFSGEALAPTYRLRMGIPGRSYGITIAERLGLPAEVIAEAGGRLGEDARDLARVTESLEDRIAGAERREEEAAAAREQAEERSSELESRLEVVRAREKELRRSLQKEVDALAAEARRALEKTVREIREGEATRDVIKKGRQAIEEIRTRHVEEPVDEPRRSSGGPEDRTDAVVPGRIAVGSHVKIRESGTRGIVERLDGDRARVRRGSFALDIDVARLEMVVEEGSVKVAKGWSRGGESIVDSETSVDLRGKRVDEVEDALYRFVDGAMLAGIGRIEIIHGMGTGALRRRISVLLEDDDRVESMRAGNWNEGGTGVTIVTLCT